MFIAGRALLMLALCVRQNAAASVAGKILMDLYARFLVAKSFVYATLKRMLIATL